MNHRLLRVLTALPVAGLVLLTQPATSSITVSAASPLDQLTKMQKRLVSGLVSQELSQQSAAPRTASRPPNYFPTSDDGCPVNHGNNVKVNQNCLNITDASLQGRGQAQNETAIAQNPFNPQLVVATYNDYRRGDGTCGGSFSRDGGRTWTDTTIPNGFTRGGAFGDVPRQYWHASGDTSIAWDTKGNAYFNCQVFMRGPGSTNNPDFSSADYLFRSTRNGGASWNFPGRPVVEQSSTTFLPLIDRPYMTVDNHVGSPFQDRVYVTWTWFKPSGTGNIYEAYSSDYGQTFSAPVLVSTTSTLCAFSVAGTHNCDSNQDAQPFTGSDGNLYVVFNNFNNAVNSAQDNRNQILLSKSQDGGVTFSAPIKVADYYDLPDCDTYQGAGQDPNRACVPEQGSQTRSVFRASNYPSAGVNPKDANQIVVTFGSYINRFSNETTGCVPAAFAADGNNTYTGVKTPACNNKIVVSVSTDGGVTFTGTAADPRALPTVNTPEQAGKDQWWQWAAFDKQGSLAVSYYDRQYGADETTGNMDISLSGSRDLTGSGVSRVTSSSMPLPTQFPNAQGNSVFFGDYSGLSAVDQAIPAWMDTRSLDLFVCPGTATPGHPPQLCGATTPSGLQANDQDIFAARVTIPSGDGENGGGGGGGGGGGDRPSSGR